MGFCFDCGIQQCLPYIYHHHPVTKEEEEEEKKKPQNIYSLIYDAHTWTQNKWASKYPNNAFSVSLYVIGRLQLLLSGRLETGGRGSRVINTRHKLPIGRGRLCLALSVWHTLQ